ETSVRNQAQHFRPMALQRAWRHVGDEGAPAIPALLIAYFNRRVHLEPQALGVGSGDEDVVAFGAGERVAILLDHRVELLAAARGEDEGIGIRREAQRRRRNRHQMRLAVDRGKRTMLAEPRAAPLELVALEGELFDPGIGWDGLRDI